jgi:CheY-like chemotaxis protein
VPRRVLLVVDRAVVRFALKDDLVRRRFQVEACATPASALELARSLARRGMPFFLICDLLLPDASGKGWRGGLDLVREIVRLAPGTPALMVGELRDAAAREAARAAGALGYLALPDLGAADLQAVGGRVAEFCSQVRAVLRDPQGFGADGGASAPGPVRVVDHLSLLRGLIGELHAEEEVEIPLLVLRLAAEYFERAVLFSVRGAEAHGVGAFGESLDGGPGLDDRVRGAALPLMRGSLLQRAAHGRASYVGPIARSRPDAALIERLGPPAPEEAALLPITGGAHAFGVLYGDNATSRRPIGDLRGLEIFLAQAGSALRNAALQRRLEAAGGRASGGAGPHG